MNQIKEEMNNNLIINDFTIYVISKNLLIEINNVKL